MKRFSFLCAALAWASLAHRAEPPSTPWVRTDKSAMRLQAQGMQGKDYIVGVEIELTGNAVTYWCDPGEAGVPPTFSFAGSDNIAKTEVLYPFPQRMNEGGVLAFGYREHVTFPIRITPGDSGKPVQFKLRLDYAVCDRVCMPAHGDAELTLSAQDNASQWAAPPDLPGVLANGSNGVYTLRAPTSNNQPIWQLTPTDKSWLADAHADLFLEAPDGWYFDTAKKPEGDGFNLTLAQKPKDAAWPVEVTVTFGTPAKSWQATLHLDEPPKAP